MKMKKLLAGVLSAAMVATMIPASMAFSGVSAAPEDSLVESYDFTQGETQGWTAEGTNANSIVVDANGITFQDGLQATNQLYTIDNPLRNQANDGFSVEIDVASMSTGGEGMNKPWETLFSFNGVNGDSNNAGFFSVSSGVNGVHYNDGSDNFWDNTSLTLMDLSNGGKVVLTVSPQNYICLYLDGNPVSSFTPSGYTGSPQTVVSYVNNMAQFSIGANPMFWGQYGMTVAGVAFYKSALTEDEVTSLGAYQKPEIPETTFTYNLATDTTGWNGYSYDSNFNTITGNDSVTVDSNGAVLPQGNNTYGIANPLRGNVDDAVTVEMVVTLDENAVIDDTNGLFGFTNHEHWNFFSVGNTGYSVAANNSTGYFDLNTGDAAEGKLLKGQQIHYAMVATQESITFYQNGEVIATNNAGTSNTDYVASQALSWINTAQYFDLGTSRTQNGAYACVMPGTGMTVSSVTLSNTAYTAAQIEEDYAQSIADDLNVTMLGRQLGTTSGGQNGVRFVARVDESVLNNSAVTRLGWMSANNSTVVTDIDTPSTLTRVTDASAFDESATGYAYTLVAAKAENDITTNTAVLPCVEITVNGNSYWFAYNGIYGAYNTEKSMPVAAIDVSTVAFPAV